MLFIVARSDIADAMARYEQSEKAIEEKLAKLQLSDNDTKNAVSQRRNTVHALSTKPYASKDLDGAERGTRTPTLL